MSKRLWSVLAPLIACSAGAHAGEKGTYAGVALMKTSYKEQGVPLTFEPVGVMLMLGLTGDNGLGAEVRLGTGVSPDRKRAEIQPFNFAAPTPGSVSVELSSLAGLYFTAQVPVTGPLHAYGLLGLSSVHMAFTADIPGQFHGTGKSDGNELSYGLGLRYKAADKMAVTFEYMHIVSNDEVTLTSLNLGGEYRF